MPRIVRDLPSPNPDAPYQVAPPEFEFPFVNNGDSEAFILTRFYKQTLAGWQADRLAAKYLPGCDPDTQYPGAYLIQESKPVRTETGMCRFTRTYARIPAQQVVPSSMFITKPDIPGTFPQNFGDYLITKPVSTVSSYDAYTRKTVTSDSGAVSSLYPTGGTYTLTFGADTTTAIAYNASSSTLATAVNLLASITAAGGVTISGTYNSTGGFTITFASVADVSITSSITSADASTAYLYLQKSNSGYTQTLFIQTPTYSDFTGGTFTVTILGQTTASIAITATAATVQSAINALSNVSARGGVTVTTLTAPGGSSYPTIANAADQIGFTIKFANSAITTGVASLTPTGSTATIAITDGTVGRTQKLTFVAGNAARAVFVSGGHDISPGDTIYVLADGVYTSDFTQFTATSSDTLTFTNTAGTIYTATAITEIGPLFKSGYTPSVTLSRIKRVTDFYLPGISPGIASADDIPLPTYQGDPASLLDAIFSGSTSINYEVGELTRWRDSPILARTTTTLNAATLT